MDIPLISYLNVDGTLQNNYKVTLSVDFLLYCYRTMLLTRLIDERMIILQRQGTISFAMSSLGEEACSVASAAALNINDWMYPQYRESGVLFFRGFKPLQYINHMFGNKNDLILGRQMPNHFGSKELNVVTVSSPIGTKIPHAAGAAYAMKIKGEQQVTICYFGEGATSEGDFHAGLNFASVRKAPVIFFCRNNGYAISTSCKNQFACESIACRGESYGMPAFKIDGNDFFAVFDTVKKAKEIALEKKTPILIEAMTYRMGSHSTSDDPTLYRTEEDVNCWKEKCPILRVFNYLKRENLWDEEKDKVLIQSLNDEITSAITTAKETKRSKIKNIIEHVYFEVPQKLKEEYQELIKLFPEDE